MYRKSKLSGRGTDDRPAIVVGDKPYRLIVVAVLLLTFLPGELAQAQLRVLSKGNSREEWRKAQLMQIEAQLTDKSTTGPLKLELEAEKRWLSSYVPGQMSGELPKATGKEPQRQAEPILDPEKKADGIRKKLLGPKAKPTAADTEQLRTALQKSSDDIGLRQLQLHWLDQPQYREDYSIEIAEAATRLLGLLEKAKLSKEELKLARAFTIYRQARALGYRLDPDVVAKHPLDAKDRKSVEEQLVGAYNQLVQLVGTGRAEFALLEIRMLRRESWNGRALELLELHGHMIEPRWYLEKRRDLLSDLGWKIPADEAAALFAVQFPEEAKSSPPNRP